MKWLLIALCGIFFGKTFFLSYLRHLFSFLLISKFSLSCLCFILINNVFLRIGAAVLSTPVSERKLGARQCTWGPSYWCSNITWVIFFSFFVFITVFVNLIFNDVIDVSSIDVFSLIVFKYGKHETWID